MEISVVKAVPDFNSSLENLEHIIYQKAMEWARNTYRAVLDCIDEQIRKKRGEQFSIIRKDETWHTTILGSVRVKRRYYRARDGSYHYLLDELMGITKHRHISRQVQRLSLEMAVQMPYRRVSAIMSKATPVSLSHQTICRIVERVAGRCLDSHDQAIAHLASTGEIPWGKDMHVSRLIIEADGVMIPLQGESRRRIEAKLGISYEGHRQVGRDRYRTVGKQVFADITSSNSFWSAMTLKLGQYYDLSGCDTVLGGDGAGWIRQGADRFNSSYNLCRFHLNRNLTRTLGYENRVLKEVREVLRTGDVSLAIRLLEETRLSVSGDRRKDITRFAGYIRANASGITPDTDVSGGLRGTGAIEGNIDKIIVKRMKNQGMSWSINGARRMLFLRAAWYEDRLDGCLADNPSPRLCRLPEKTVRKVIDKKLNQDYGKYFAAGIPALAGPHASRPWVKVLKSITGGL